MALCSKKINFNKIDFNNKNFNKYNFNKTNFFKKNLFFKSNLLIFSTFLTSNAYASTINDFADWQNALLNGGNYELSSSILANGNLGNVNSNLTINGNNHSILGNSFSGIVVNSTGNLTLTNIGGTSGSWQTSKNNIVNNGTLSIDNVIFQQNETITNQVNIGSIILNKGQIDSISNVVMDSNRVINPTTEIRGGLISNGVRGSSISGNIDEIVNSRFTNNYIQSTNYATHGGIIYNTNSTIGRIDSSIFENNVSEVAPNSSGGGVYGGVIDNNNGGTINLISNSVFRGNKIIRTGTTGASDAHASATAIDNYGIIGKIEKTLFENNSTYCETCNATGGAIMNVKYASTSKLGSIEDSIFRGNYVESGINRAYAGAISTNADIDNITNVAFINNGVKSNNTKSSSSAVAGAIYNGGNIKNMTNVIFDKNYIIEKTTGGIGGAIANNGRIDKITDSIFANNSITAEGNVYGGAISNFTAGTIGEIINTSFIDNSATSHTGSAYGGAIVSATDLNIKAINGNSMFSGNTANGVSNAIYVANASGNINLTSDNGLILFEDGIDGLLGYDLNINSLNNGEVIFNNDIKNADINNTAEKTYVGKASYLNNNNSLTLNGGNLNVLSMNLDNLLFRDLSLTDGNLNLASVDVDLNAINMGSIKADNYNIANAQINVNGMNIISDSNDMVTDVNFVENQLAGNISTTVDSALGPVFEYDVSYLNNGDFRFFRGNYNKEVLSPSENTAVASLLSSEIYSRMLSDVDNPFKSPMCSRDVGGAFVKSFASDENIDLKNLPGGANTDFNGVIAGFESNRINEGKGIYASYNAYAAYAKADNKFNSDKFNQTAYYLGVGATFYKEKGFIGTTANIAMMNNEGKDLYGKDKFNSYLAGAAVKAGYNYDVLGLVVQPNIYASYTYINSNDYSTGRGARVELGDMYNIELAPGVKVAKEFDLGLQTYTKARYVHTFNEGQEVKANGFDLPEISVKPYVEYGLGLEKSSDDWKGYVEILRRDGGREGWNGLIGVNYHW